jgi:MarR family transcriptional regulator, organic hydroperoxide resistance regulator
MDDFIRALGPAFLAHLLRRLSDELVQGAADWYPKAGVAAPPRTASTLLALDANGPLGVTTIASLLRQSHPLVITWIRQLETLALVETLADPHDRRRSVIALTRKGRVEVKRLRAALVPMERASRELLDAAAPGLFEALWRMEQACRAQPFAQRLEGSALARRPNRSGNRAQAR